jgi:hypothetical protein
MKLRFGDICRSVSGAPARYISHDFCLYVSAMTNELLVALHLSAKGGEEELPLPTDRECQAAYWGISAGKGIR